MNLTREQVLSEPSGRELDALVAEQVFGWRWLRYPAPNLPDDKWLALIAPPLIRGRQFANGYNQPGQPADSEAERFYDWDGLVWYDNGETHHGLPHYSTGLEAAWQVIEALASGGRAVQLQRIEPGNAWRCQLVSVADDEPPVGATGTTAPLAVCRAALLNVLAEEQKPIKLQLPQLSLFSALI